MADKGYKVDDLKADLNSLGDTVKEIREEIEAEDLDQMKLEALEREKRQLSEEIAQRKRNKKGLWKMIPYGHCHCSTASH